MVKETKVKAEKAPKAAAKKAPAAKKEGVYMPRLQEVYEKTVRAELQKQFNYAEYPGAIVCGIDGIVIKVHGSASPKAFLSSILGAADCIQKQVIARIKQQLQSGKSHDKLL